MKMNVAALCFVTSLVLASIGYGAVRIASSTPAHEQDGTSTLALSASTKQPAQAVDSDLQKILEYRKWTRVHTTPLPLSASLDILCRIPTREEEIQTSSNPHRRKYFSVYVNDAGYVAMMSQAKPLFPPGSIIVKEKLLAKESATPELLTVMLKHDRGFDKSNGDWEYMVVKGDTMKIEGRGQLASCSSCHTLKRETDYVFRSYLPVDVASKLR
jgi:hypothetical protein